MLWPIGPSKRLTASRTAMKSSKFWATRSWIIWSTKTWSSTRCSKSTMCKSVGHRSTLRKKIFSHLMPTRQRVCLPKTNFWRNLYAYSASKNISFTIRKSRVVISKLVRKCPNGKSRNLSSSGPKRLKLIALSLIHLEKTSKSITGT